MRNVKIALGIALTVCLPVSTQAVSADSPAADNVSVSQRVQKYCDPVCELQAQDSAFSLVIEAYRQFQSRQIELDYESRLKAAAHLDQEPGSLVIGTTLTSMHTMRAWVEALAGKERDLRLEQLQTRVANFTTTYHCARKADETVLAQTVASKVDAKAAAQQLRSLRLLSLGSPTRANFQTVTSRPAADIFLDAAPADTWPEQLAGPCEETPPPKQAH